MSKTTTALDHLEDIASTQQHRDRWEPVRVTLTDAPVFEYILRSQRLQRLQLTLAAEYDTGKGMDAQAKQHAREGIARAIYSPLRLELARVISALYAGVSSEAVVKMLLQIEESLK
jgi:hypothetical protein